MDKKDISVKTAVKGLINGFVSYSVLILFLFLILIIVGTWILNNNQTNLNYDIIKFTLPLIASIIIFFAVRAICKLSTFDLFNKCKIEKEKIESVSSKMNLFFIGCIVFSVIAIILFLTAKFHNQQLDIEEVRIEYYSTYSENYAESLTSNMISEFKIERSDTILQTLIIETGLLLGIFSLVPTQKKLIEKYN